MKRLLCALLCIAVLLPMASGCSFLSGKFTLMVYMVGSDLESKNMAASNDIAEMLEAELDLNRVNLLVFTGGSEMWYVDVPNDGNATLLLTEKEGMRSFTQLEKSEENHSMGESETLTAFLSYAYENYSAEHYGLICWDHGNGPLMGFGKDKLFENDSLELSELRQALEASPFREKKLDFIGFDACLMSSIEVADTLYPYADYMIASQETEPGEGWNYEFLKTFNSSYDTEKLAQSVIDSYHDYYEANKKLTSSPDLTLSCLNLKKIDGVTEAMNGLFGAMKTTLDGGGYQQLAVERSMMKTFGEAGGSKGWSLDMVDLGALMDECEDDYADEVDTLRAAMDDLVVINRANINSAAGVSIYYPYNGSNVYAANGVEVCKTFDTSSVYQQYLSEFIQVWSKDWLTANNKVKKTTSAISDDEIILDENKITVRLTDEQRQNLSKVYLNVYRKPDADYEFYVPQLYMDEVTPEEDGTVIINADIKVPTVNGKYPLSLMQVSEEKDRSNYKTLSTAVKASMSAADMSVTVYCSVENGSDDILITSVEYGEEDQSPVRSGKATLNADQWEALTMFNWGGKPTRDANGALLQVADWDTSAYSGYSQSIDNMLTITMQSINQQELFSPSDFYYQIATIDTGGHLSFSELEQFPDKTTEPAIHEEKSEKGVMTFEVYKDHAGMISYEGNDTDLTIPEKVAGKPVTAMAYEPFTYLYDNQLTLSSLTISNPDFNFSKTRYQNIQKIILPDGLKSIPGDAFSNVASESEVVIPDSVESIGTRAFFSYSPRLLKRLKLPKNLRSIGVSAFGGCYFEDGLTIDEDNPYYQVKDDMLLTKDGKTLISYFGHDTALAIPEGVEVIEPYAHIGDRFEKKPFVRLTQIEFPSTLKRIRYSAFTEESIDNLIFPDSLEEIGHYAFGNSLFGNDESTAVNRIYLGKSLRRIGITILNQSVYDRLEVSEDNLFYAVKNNRLTNKAGYSDLSEIALSASDNLKVNESEYRCFELATTGLDLSRYIKSEDRKYNKSYNGSEYCLNMELSDTGKEESSFTGTGNITLLGEDITLPCKYGAFDALGLSALGDAPPDTVEANGSVNFTIGEDGKTRISLRAKNFDTEPKEPEECDIFEVALGSYFDTADKRTLPSFEYLALTQDSKPSDVIAKLGEPFKIEISEDRLTLTYEVYDADNYISFNANGAEFSFRYRPETDDAVIVEAKMLFGYNELYNKDKPTPSYSSEEAEATYRNYAAAVKNVDINRYRKMDKLTFDGKDFYNHLELKTEEECNYQGSEDITIMGKPCRLAQPYSSFPPLGLPVKRSPEETESNRTDSVLLYDAATETTISIRLQNNGEASAKPEDCTVCGVTLGNDDLGSIEFEYLGLTRDAKAADVIRLIGEPCEIFVYHTSFSFTYHNKPANSRQSSSDDSLYLYFKYDEEKKTEYLYSVQVNYGYQAVNYGG